jgi:hypothetical protein
MAAAPAASRKNHRAERNSAGFCTFAKHATSTSAPFLLPLRKNPNISSTTVGVSLFLYFKIFHSISKHIALI